MQELRSRLPSASQHAGHRRGVKAFGGNRPPTSAHAELKALCPTLSCAAPQSVDLAPGSDEAIIGRRAILSTPLVLALVAAAPLRVHAEELAAVVEVPSSSYGSKLKELYDPILAYRFNYPSETTSGKPLRMVLAHEPEKYSSAAPLTADARQRIVSELIDLRNFVTVSMTVGPAAGVLKGRPVEEWRPMDVALTVLIDRSTSRTTNGQRVALNDVEEAVVEQRPDGRYFLYEHLSQGSPTPQERSKETYRHALAVTATRPGLDGTPYLYTLNLSCRQDMWNELSPLFAECARSFELTPPTSAYVPPDKDPWRFF